MYSGICEERSSLACVAPVIRIASVNASPLAVDENPFPYFSPSLGVDALVSVY